MQQEVNKEIEEEKDVDRTKSRPKGRPRKADDGTGKTSKTKTEKKEKKKKEFRLASKSFFLAYPQCDVPLSFVHRIFTTRPDILKYSITDYAFASELHEDGNPHIHVRI